MALQQTWDSQRRASYRCIVPRERKKPVIIPDDIVILDRDPSPCFMCGVRADVGCRHRRAA